MGKVKFQVEGLDSNNISEFNQDVTFDGNIDANSISIAGTDIFEAIPPGPVYSTDAPLNPTTGQVWIDSDSSATAYDLTGYATLASPSFTGLISSGPISITQSSNSSNYPITISSANEQGGGSGYADIVKLTNSKSGASNINKHIRLNSTGGFEIVNSAYTATIFHLADNGALTAVATYNGATLGDTGWVQITSFGSGWSAVGQAVYSRVINNVVYMRGNVYNATGSGTGAFTLPVGHRPSTEGVFAVQKYGAGELSYITIGTDGVVIPNSTGAWLTGVQFPVG